MRAVDERECKAFGHTGKQALREAVLNSTHAWTAFVDDRPEAMFGLVVNSALTGEGAPWFLGTDEVYRHGRELLMWGPAIVTRMHDSSPRLRGLVSRENTAAIRLLRKWGFNVELDRQRIGGADFYPFEAER